MNYYFTSGVIGNSGLVDMAVMYITDINGTPKRVAMCCDKIVEPIPVKKEEAQFWLKVKIEK